MLFLVSQSFFPALNYTHFFFTLLSVRNFKFSVFIEQLRDNNLKYSVIHMNNISEISLNIIFGKYVSVSHSLNKNVTGRAAFLDPPYNACYVLRFSSSKSLR